MHRLNHMAMTLPRGTITDEWLADIKAFYGEIFGWEVRVVRMGDGPDVPIHHVYMQLDPAGLQYLYIGEDDNAMTVAGMEHLGIITETLDEVDELFEKCERFREKDDRVVISPPGLVTVDPGAEVFTMRFDNGWVPPYVVHGFNVRYLMPVGWDIQHDTYKTGPDKVWEYVANGNRTASFEEDVSLPLHAPPTP